MSSVCIRSWKREQALCLLKRPRSECEEHLQEAAEDWQEDCQRLQEDCQRLQEDCQRLQEATEVGWSRKWIFELPRKS
jgi:hypothetical protein